MDKTFILCACTLFLATLIVQLYVTKHVKEPYMDEIFHYDQINQYCNGNFSYWNPKISTPPGLYLLTMPLTEAIRFVTTRKIAYVRWLPLPADWSCSIRTVRLLNCIWLLALYAICVKILAQQKWSGHFLDRRFWPSVTKALHSVNLCLMPVLYFSRFFPFTLHFGATEQLGIGRHADAGSLMPTGPYAQFISQTEICLYYTDLVSTVLVLAMYALMRAEQNTASALMGALAITLRQTNIVWLVFCAGLCFVDQVSAYLMKHEDINTGSVLHTYVSAVRKFIHNKGYAQLLVLVSINVLQCFPYVLVLAVSAVFALKNNGLAFGDHSAHQPVPHFVQLFYCATVSVMFSSVCFARLAVVKAFVGFLRSNFRNVVYFCTLGCLVVLMCTYEHEYLIADNRHYTFYLWRRVIRRAYWVRFMLVPLVYLPAVWLVTYAIQPQSQVWMLGFVAAVTLVVVPNKLLEFRYFIVPYLMWRLHFRVSLVNKFTIFGEFLVNLMINAFTIYVFCNLPFEWKHEKGVQRFMW